MERLTQKTSGLSANALRTWGILMLAAGIISRSILQNQLLGMEGGTTGLLELISADPNAMTIASVALVLQALESCAIPIFAFLLLEGLQHTADFLKYLLRIAGTALLSELPYNLAIGGKVFDLSSRNPVFGLVLCMILVWFYRRYAEKSLAHVLVRILVTFMGLLWISMLSIDHGVSTLLVFCGLWIFRRKPLFRNLAGTSAAILSSLVSPFYLASPLSFLAIHFYNEEPGNGSRLRNYLAYPILLLATGLAAKFLF